VTGWRRAALRVSRALARAARPPSNGQRPPPTPWPTTLATAALDFNEPVALDLLRNVFPRFRDEYAGFPREPTAPGGFYLSNGYFEAVDAEVLYCMIRDARPRQVIEVGSGYSTLIARQALSVNGSGHLVAIDPEPRAAIAHAIDEHIAQPVQALDPAFFERLEPNDILFIDSSHVVAAGGDVTYLFFDVLPRLKGGVRVHVHDIFLPLDYPPRWVAAGNTEQYLLLAFLSYNRAFEVLWPGSFMRERHFDLVARTFPSCTSETRPGSFWMRRRSQDQ
jgi:methyltransferase family protein